MRPAEFDLLRPRSLQEVLDDRSLRAGTARLLAGGQTLMPQVIRRDARPVALIDLGSVTELRGIRDMGDTIWVGAMEPMVAIEQSTAIASRIPLLAHAVGKVAHLPIRTRGTIGGSVANADPAAELPLVMATLGAHARIASPGGERTATFCELLDGPFTTTMHPTDVIIGFEVPVPAARWGFHEVSPRHNDRPLALAAAIEVADGRIRLGAGPTTRSDQVVTVTAPLPTEVDGFADDLVGELDLLKEAHCPPHVRRASLQAAVARTLRQLIASGDGDAGSG